jgi:hypothetical protein
MKVLIWAYNRDEAVILASDDEVLMAQVIADALMNVCVYTVHGYDIWYPSRGFWLWEGQYSLGDEERLVYDDDGVEVWVRTRFLGNTGTLRPATMEDLHDFRISIDASAR